MNISRRDAVLVGVFFIAATGFFSIGQAISTPILGSPDALELAATRSHLLVAGVLIEVVGVLSIPMTAVFLFPTLKRHSEVLALAYIGIRLIEAVPLLLVDANTLALVATSESYVIGSGPDSMYWRAVGGSIQAMSASNFMMSVGLVFPVGAILLNSMLLRTRLVPRFIAGWGLLAAALLLGGSVLSLFDVFAAVPATTLEVILAGPIAVQEMVFAVWLIVRGFDGERLARLPST